MSTELSERDALRDRMRSVREGISAVRRQTLGVQIQNHLSDFLGDRKVVGLASYAAIHSEVDLAAFHAEWVTAGNQLFLPRTLDANQLEFAPFVPDEPLKIGAYGISEPIGDAVEPEVIDAILVPGLAFDSAGGRLGYGAGYYDRFLSRLANARSDRAVFVGVAFQPQVVANVPMDSHDVPVDVVLTDEGVVWSRASGPT